MTELLDDPNENWMSNHSNNKLADLIIPGTHNSAAYKISNHLICSKLWWIGKLGKRFVLTQTLTITEQLKLGIRAFDLRISLLNNKPYVSHTCRLSSLKSILLQILAYLNDHPTEVILIRVKGDWDNRPKCWKSTVSLIRNILGNYLCIPKQDSVGLQSIISDLCRENTRVMIYSNELCEYQLPCYNENDHFKEYWYNTMSLDKLSNLMEIDIVNPNQYPSQCKLIGPVLTPTQPFILNRILKFWKSTILVDNEPLNWRNLKDMADDANSLALSMLLTHANRVSSKNFNIFHMDFCSKPIIDCLLDINCQIHLNKSIK